MLKKSFKLKFRDSSKSKEKKAKYIPAAIIPSAAFVANPTIPSSRKSIDANSNNLFNSTLNSSLVGLSEEFRKHQIDKDNDLNIEEGYDERVQSFENINKNIDSRENEYDLRDIHDNHRQNRSKRKKKKSLKSDIDVEPKRHISIANGLFQKSPSTSKTRPSKQKDFDTEVPNVDNVSGSIRSLFINEEKAMPTEDKVPIKKLEFEYLETRDDFEDEGEVSFIIDRNTSKEAVSLQDFEQESIPVGFEKIIKGNGHEGLTVDHTYDSAIAEQSTRTWLPVPNQFSDSKSVQEEDNLDGVYLVPFRNKKRISTKQEGDDQSNRQLKDEIRILQDTIYRLSVEISHLFKENEPGRSIGKSVFPGKGPAPSWIMNTKYLTPLIAAYDIKFQRQNAKIDTMKEEVLRFEKEIRAILNENERLHLIVQENGKGGPSNHKDWHIIVEQTKLVIEENQLLLKELDIQQLRMKELENKHFKEVSKLKTQLPKITSEGENEEIENLVGKISERNAIHHEIMSTHRKKRIDQEPEVIELQTQIKDLLKRNQSLENEIDHLQNNEKKMKKKIEKLKITIKSEKEFHQYLGDVIDKSNEIANERDRLAEAMTLRDGEIRRVSTKLMNDMKYNSDLGIDFASFNCIKKSEDAVVQELYSLEQLTKLLVQSLEDVNSRCRNQEKDVHYYQSLLREKDKSLQEYEKENEDLESKLDLLWKNATKDN